MTLTTATVTPAPSAAARQRADGPRQETQILSRLRKATGQLTGISKMYEDGRYCIDILDQLAAVNAAIDAVALLVLTDHVHACVREAIEAGDADDKVEELVSTLRRYVRTR